jgi:hypothetical protein
MNKPSFSFFFLLACLPACLSQPTFQLTLFLTRIHGVSISMRVEETHIIDLT